jgi:hypothetical protein
MTKDIPERQRVRRRGCTGQTGEHPSKERTARLLKQYEKPQLTAYGSVYDLTRGLGTKSLEAPIGRTSGST